jgi:hypothetical protein
MSKRKAASDLPCAAQLYVLRVGARHTYKIGITADGLGTGGRARALQTGSVETLAVVASLLITPATARFKVEAYVHANLDHCRERGGGREFFTDVDEDPERFVRRVEELVNEYQSAKLACSSVLRGALADSWLAEATQEPGAVQPLGCAQLDMALLPPGCAKQLQDLIQQRNRLYAKKHLAELQYELVQEEFQDLFRGLPRLELTLGGQRWLRSTPMARFTIRPQTLVDQAPEHAGRFIEMKPTVNVAALRAAHPDVALALNEARACVTLTF